MIHEEIYMEWNIQINKYHSCSYEEKRAFSTLLAEIWKCFIPTPVQQKFLTTFIFYFFNEGSIKSLV